MSKEFIWGANVEGERTEFKVVVEDGLCMTYEGGELTNRFEYTLPDEANAMWIDEVIQVWGKRCRFQLDKGVPYLQMDGKWTASDTTTQERMLKMARSQKLGAMVQFVIGVALCLACGILYLVNGSLGDKWWFLIIMGSVMGVTGLLQYHSVKKEFNI